MFDGVWEGSVFFVWEFGSGPSDPSHIPSNTHTGKTDVEQLMVKDVGRGEREVTVESGEGDITLEVKGREPEFEVCL